MDCSPPGSSVHEILQGKNTIVGCYALLRGIFPTQGLNPGSLMFSALASVFFTISATREAWFYYFVFYLIYALNPGSQIT